MTGRTASDARAEYWRTQIDAWQISGQSQHAFCKANDLNYPNFGYWLRKLRQQDVVTPSARRTSGFVPVVASPVAGDLSVRLPNGIELHGVTEQNLSLVAQLLARL